MPNHHIDRINDDIRRVVAAKLRDVKDPRLHQGDMLTVTHTETSNDLRHCRVYISVLGTYNTKTLMQGLMSVSGFLRRELGNCLRLRYTPELTFVLDNSIAHGAHINQIIQDLRNQHDDHDNP